VGWVILAEDLRNWGRRAVSLLFNHTEASQKAVLLEEVAENLSDK
jgi:hypothetical protein